MQVGDSEIVIYDKLFQEEHTVRDVGRMELHEGQYSFVGVPTKISNPAMVSNDYVFTNRGKIFAETGDLDVKQVPILHSQIVNKGKRERFEDLQKILNHVYQPTEKPVLHDPSGMTVGAIRDYKLAWVLETRNPDTRQYWEENRRRDEEIKMCQNYRGDTPVFLGISLPTGQKKWWAMLPNPYTEVEDETKLSCSETPERFSVTPLS